MIERYRRHRGWCGPLGLVDDSVGDTRQLIGARVPPNPLPPCESTPSATRGSYPGADVDANTTQTCPSPPPLPPIPSREVDGTAVAAAAAAVAVVVIRSPAAAPPRRRALELNDLVQALEQRLLRRRRELGEPRDRRRVAVGARRRGARAPILRAAVRAASSRSAVASRSARASSRSAIASSACASSRRTRRPLQPRRLLLVRLAHPPPQLRRHAAVRALERRVPPPVLDDARCRPPHPPGLDRGGVRVLGGDQLLPQQRRLSTGLGELRAQAALGTRRGGAAAAPQRLYLLL